MKKQPNSQMCFGCGVENPIGLKLSTYEMDDGRVVARFTPREDYQGYPGVLHGGIIATVLDEVLYRVWIAKGPWLVTAKIEMKFRRPVPVGVPLTVVAEAVESRGRRLISRGEIRLPDGSVGAEATAVFLELPEEQVVDMGDAQRFWRVVPDEDGPPAFELGSKGARVQRSRGERGTRRQRDRED
ncbi:MAG: PaaI family thioesterase [Anaerolineae bacterium]